MLKSFNLKTNSFFKFKHFGPAIKTKSNLNNNAKANIDDDFVCLLSCKHKSQTMQLAGLKQISVTRNVTHSFSITLILFTNNERISLLTVCGLNVEWENFKSFSMILTILKIFIEHYQGNNHNEPSPLFWLNIQMRLIYVAKIKSKSVEGSN